ncbi:unnamed protein product [Alternaria alternata]
MSLDGDDEVEGRELVLRGGKLSPRSSPTSDPSERRQRQPIHPIPVSSARVDQKDGAQRVVDGNAYVQNSTNAKCGSQTLENPFATNFLTNSAPIYNQNVNSGSGQQNIQVIGDFELPSSYTPTAAPPEYEIPFESEHNEKRGSGLQKSNVSNGIKNKTAGDDRPNGYSQTLREPHGLEADSRIYTSMGGWASKRKAPKSRLLKVQQQDSQINSHLEAKPWMNDYNRAKITD